MYLELRIATCACMLAIASILDIKKREVPDKVWLTFGGAGILLTILELFVDGNPGNNTTSSDYQNRIAYFVHFSVGLAIMSAIGYVTYRAGFFGGADSKALVTISIILPVYNANFQLHSFPALSIFSNAIFVSITAMLYNVLRNTISVAKRVPIFEGVEETGFRKALAFTVGYQAKSCGKFMFAMEEADDLGRRRFRFNPLNYDDFAEQGRETKKIWVTHALPFIVYIGAGFMITILFGDLMSFIMKLIISQ